MRVVHYGLGPIGLDIARIVAERDDLHTVAAVDIDPDMVGRTMESVLQAAGGSDVIIGNHLEPDVRADVALICTGSTLSAVKDQVLEAVDMGMNVVSTCEELAYPWAEAADLAAQLDAAAKSSGVSILGTGVNPGFAMDFLAVVASGAMRRIEHVSVHRVQDAGQRRLPLQRKVGVGLTGSRFRKLVESGSLGHVGLRQSAHLIGDALNWDLTQLTESVEPVWGNGQDGESGIVAGVEHVVSAGNDHRELISLTLRMAVGETDPRDRIVLRGEPDVSLLVPGGLHGDFATSSIVANSIYAVVSAPPGIRLVTQLPPPTPRANGLRSFSTEP